MTSTRTTLLAYGGLALPIAIAEIPIVNYLPAFYAQEMHLGAGLIGVVLFAARIWDGIYDLLVGWLSDRSTSRFGRRKPWAILGAPFLILATWFLCHPPPGSGLLYLGFWAVLFYTAFTSVRIPHLSWGTELATDYVERSRVFSFREAFTMLGFLVFCVAPLIWLPSAAPLHQVLSLIAVIIIVSVPLTTLPLFWVKDPPQRERSGSQPLRELLELARDRILRRFALARLFFYIEEGIIGSLLVFSFGVGLKLPDKFFWLILILWVATLAAVPFMLRLARRFEKHHLLAAGLAIYSMGLATLVFAPVGNFVFVALIWVIVGFANSAIVTLPTSIVADIVDHDEVSSDKRRSGAYVAIDNLTLKVGLAVGLAVAFGLLDAVGYDPSAAQHSAADAWKIRVLGFGLPALLLIPSIILILKHPITRSVQSQLREKIELRSTCGESA